MPRRAEPRPGLPTILTDVRATRRSSQIGGANHRTARPAVAIPKKYITEVQRSGRSEIYRAGTRRMRPLASDPGQGAASTTAAIAGSGHSRGLTHGLVDCAPPG